MRDTPRQPRRRRTAAFKAELLAACAQPGASLPAHLPRIEVRHEPDSTQCACGCSLTRIGEDVSEKLDYTPGVFSVERPVRGKRVCRGCETLMQAPVPPHVIDKGVETTGLLAHVLVARYLDHLPLYRQEGFFGFAGLEIPRSTLAQWVGRCGGALQPLVDALVDVLREAMFERGVLHADETPVSMLAPGAGKTHKACVCAYGTTPYDPLQAVVCDFAGYKALFATGVTEVGCMAHARRKFHDLWVSHKSPLAEEALGFFRTLYEIERTAQHSSADERQRLRILHTRPVLDTLHRWLRLQRQQATDGTAAARAIDYSLKRWSALGRYVDDGDLPGRQQPPGEPNQADCAGAGELAVRGHDPHADVRDVLARLPTQPASRIEELLPHRWSAAWRLRSDSARWVRRTVTGRPGNRRTT